MCRFPNVKIPPPIKATPVLTSESVIVRFTPGAMMFPPNGGPPSYLGLPWRSWSPSIVTLRGVSSLLM